MGIAEVKTKAEKRADAEAKRGTVHWAGIYYGFVIGYQDAKIDFLLTQSKP